MQDLTDQRQSRLEKLQRLRSLGVNPYPYRFEPTHTVPALHAGGDALVEAGTPVQVAGRLMAVRDMGKAAFAHIKDQHERIQVYVRRDVVGDEAFERFGLADLGDYLGLAGTMMRTRTGELTVRVERLELLSKALRPLPLPKVESRDGEEVVHQGLRDVEQRYRQRYVDLALHDDVARVFRQRSAIVQAIRDYLLEQGFLEVETPVLQPVYGGASARPFTTHHEALDMQLFLRVATELYLKRLVAGGLDRVFEIGKNFRNEGIDRSHNPEFTMVEFYQAYADYTDMMEHFERIYARCAEAVHGSTRFTYQGVEMDVAPPWRRLTMYEALAQLGGVDFRNLSDEQVQGLLGRHGIELVGGYNRGRAMAELFETLCEPRLVQPTFITDFPKESTPLCKAHREDPDLVERFEPYIYGWEVGNAYSELNDPQVQQALFEEQVRLRQGGDLEAQPMDADFVRAMEYGMPPMGGIGMGIDRMVMLLTDQHSIRDVLLFPTMRLEAGEG